VGLEANELERRVNLSIAAQIHDGCGVWPEQESIPNRMIEIVQV
jgi:hypothetical protein